MMEFLCQTSIRQEQMELKLSETLLCARCDLFPQGLMRKPLQSGISEFLVRGILVTPHGGLTTYVDVPPGGVPKLQLGYKAEEDKKCSAVFFLAPNPCRTKLFESVRQLLGRDRICELDL